MSAPVRLLKTGLGHAAANVAFTAALAELHLRGKVADTLRLYRYRRCVLLGRSQEIGAVDAGVCRRRSVEIARRATGGGAVYMAPGILAWDLVVARARFPSPDAAAAAVGAAVVSALGKLGLAARFRLPGDVLLGELKVSGSAGWFEGGSLLHQGTLAVDCDLDEMAEMLGVPRHGLPVTTLAAERGDAPSIGAVEAALEATFGELLGGLLPAEAGPNERHHAAKLLAAEDWIVPRAPEEQAA